jgi:hypothetical protein
VGVPDTSPASVTIAIVFGLAEANTSAGAPPVMLAARESLPPKLKVTLVPGCSSSNRFPSVVKLSFSDAAANTVTVPLTSSDDEADEEDPDVAVAESSDDEHAPSVSRAVAPRAAARIDRRVRRAVRVITGPLPQLQADFLFCRRCDADRACSFA